MAKANLTFKDIGLTVSVPAGVRVIEISENIEVFVEIGPGNVLTNLLKRTLPKDTPCKLYSVNSLKGFEKFHKEIN